MGLVEGSIAVKAVINSKYRIVNKIYINKEKKGSDVAFIVNQAQKKKIKVEKVDQEIINQIANGKTHGGLVADVSERKTQSIVALLKKINHLSYCWKVWKIVLIWVIFLELYMLLVVMVLS